MKGKNKDYPLHSPSPKVGRTMQCKNNLKEWRSLSLGGGGGRTSGPCALPNAGIQGPGGQF